MTDQASAPSPASRPPWPMIIGVAVLGVFALILLALVLTRGTDGTASGSPTPSPSATGGTSASGSPSVTPSDAPSTTAAAPGTPTDGLAPVLTPPPDVLPVGSRVEVVVDALRIRARPTTDSEVVASVARGDVLFLPDWSEPGLRIGPTTAGDGLDWYAAEHIAGISEWPNDAQGDRIRGFVAAEADGQPFIALLDPRCPATVDIAALTAITAWERLACSGDRQLTIEGTYGCGVCDALAWPGTFEPEWLASYLNPIFQVLSPVGGVQQVGFDPVALAFPPDVAEPADQDAGSIMRVTGRFNDARAADCVIEIGEGSDVFTVKDTAAEWYCREQFVVEAWEVIGTDADYPTPP
jgi:hypothetical protein